MFHVTSPFLYLLSVPEVFWCFLGVQKGTRGIKRFKETTFDQHFYWQLLENTAHAVIIFFGFIDFQITINQHAKIF